MRFIILTDEKPKSCEDCYFYIENLVQVDEDKFNIERKCSLGDTKFEDCLLTEIKAVFDSDEEKTENE